MVNNKLVDITGLGRYHENLKNLLNAKENVGAADAALKAAKEYADGIVDGKFDAAGSAAQALADAKTYADGLAVNYDATGSADAALAAAKADAAEKYQVKGNYEVAGAADAALAAAKADAAEKYQVKGNYEAAGAAAQALADSKADAAEKYQVKGNYEAAGAAAQALADAKTYADGLAGNYDEKGAAAQALADAKADAASLYQVKGDYEEAGAAAEALDAAKADAAEKYQVKGEYEAVGAAAQALADAKTYADGLNTAMDARVVVLEAIDHDKLASDAAASAVATILDDAPEKFDTLKEVADWIANNESAASAADIVTRVAALEAIDHDAYVAADEAVLAAAKTYANDEIAKLSFDEAGTAKRLADAALEAAKADAASLYQVKGNYEAAGAAAQALTDAKAYTDTEVAKKQDIIDDLATIRSGAAAGATALQESDLQFADNDDIDALFA